MHGRSGRRDYRLIAANCGRLVTDEPYCSSTILPLAYSKRLSFDRNDRPSRFSDSASSGSTMASTSRATRPPQQPPATGAGQPDAGAPAAGGGLTPLTENGRGDSYVYKKLSTGTPPTGPQVTTANGSHTITATDGAKRTNFGGVYGHTLTLSEPGSNDLGTITAADPTGLLVATPAEGDPNFLSVREYKGY
jgi:hypothetical protein